MLTEERSSMPERSLRQRLPSRALASTRSFRNRVRIFRANLGSHLSNSSSDTVILMFELVRLYSFYTNVHDRRRGGRGGGGRGKELCDGTARGVRERYTFLVQSSARFLSLMD